MTTIDRCVAAGYTHLISWKEYHKNLDVFVQKSFPTTPDMVDRHIAELNSNRTNRAGVELIMDIAAINLRTNMPALR